VLHDHYLGRGLSLGQARVLWEIGLAGSELRTLRARLGLDSGYVSRLLGSLRDDGLVELSADPDDQRVRVVRATDAGRTERRALDRASDELAASLLAPLPPEDRSRLVDAMRTVERLLVRGLVRIEPANPRSAESLLALRAYFAELDARFEHGFDPGASLVAADDELTGDRGVLLVARLHDEVVAAGGVKTPPGEPALLKRMWVSDRTRGLGVGRMLLAALEDEARRRGARVVRLDTNGTLTEAIAMYRACGYVEVDDFNGEPYADHWFAKDL
jgi:DNA-binding MarR family transcriptional regulator/predicted GNAT family N-acyltransferase